MRAWYIKCLLLVTVFAFFPFPLRTPAENHLANSPSTRPVDAINPTKIFSEICSRRGEPDAELLAELRGDIGYIKKQLCECAEKKPGGARFCPSDELEGWERLFTRLKDSTLSAAQFSSGVCREYLAEERLMYFYSDLLDQCRKQPNISHLKNLVRFRKSFQDIDHPTCWTMEGITEQGCLRARPCGREANVKYLPISPKRDHLVSREMLLCNENLSAIQAIKDPEHANLLFSNPSLFWLTNGEAYFLKEYGAANCHGAAQAIQGNILDDLRVTQVTDWAGGVKGCGDRARQKLAAAGADPRIRDLKTLGGVTVNMKHRDCKPTDCGKVQLVVAGCDEKSLEDYVFVQDMCLSCWDRKLRERAGMHRLVENGDWSKLVAGCVLSQEDHSITLVMKSAGMCTFYESANPSGPARLGTAPCPQLYASFPYKWCPATPMTFRLK